VEFTIAAAPGGFTVAAVDRSDGEVFDIANVTWDGETLRFDVAVLSNGYRTQHAMRVRADGTIDDEYTAHHRDVLMRKKTPSDPVDQG